MRLNALPRDAIACQTLSTLLLSRVNKTAISPRSKAYLVISFVSQLINDRNTVADVTVNKMFPPYPKTSAGSTLLRLGKG